MGAKFGLGAGFPAEVEQGPWVAELLAIEDHAVEDAVHEGFAAQRWRGRASRRWWRAPFPSLLEAGVALTDGVVGTPHLFERATYSGNIVALDP